MSRMRCCCGGGAAAAGRIRGEKMASTFLVGVVFLAWLGSCCVVQCSVLVPTYVLPPSSFNQRDQRSLPTGSPVVAFRTLARLAGGHLKLNNHTVGGKNNHIDHAKNTFALVDKDVKNYDDKFAGVIVKTENHNIGWNQGQWDDGMLMSSAGNGKEKSKQKNGGADDDEDKKTLADQVAEGKYGLIQKELFSKTPVRPGVVSYAINPETKSKDNEASLGGLKNDEIWLAEDHLLVLKGGSYPDHGTKPGESADGETWPPIDAYKAPPRQVKIPQNPEVPPPFPVRLTDGGPLVFLTPNGSVPAPLFPARPPGSGFGLAFPPPPFGFYPPPSAPPPQGAYPGNVTAGGAPFPIAPFPYPGDSEPPPFPGSINASFPVGLPPGASFLPPPGNLTDLYDEDDPSIYYPPPYSFSYQADNSSRVPAGPLVPGIVLPPPPDFFSSLDSTTIKSPSSSTSATTTTTTSTTAAPIVIIKPQKTKVYVQPSTTEKTVSTQPPVRTSSVRPTYKHPSKVVIIAKPVVPTRVTQTQISSTLPANTVRPSAVHKQVKTTLKPVTNSISNVFYPEKGYYEENSVVSQTPRPFLIYGPPERSQLNPYSDKTAYVTSTPVPLRAYYSNSEYEGSAGIPKLQHLIKQNIPTVTRVRPDFIQSTRQNGKSVASFYFYEEPVSKVQSTTVSPEQIDYYYPNVKANNGQIVQNDLIYNQQIVDEFRPLPSREPSPFFFIPQRQGSRTLTQEYFSVQKPKAPGAYIVPQSRPESFYDQIANIQQTIDYYTTHRPKLNIYQQNTIRDARQKPIKIQSSRPVYQFSFQSNTARPEQNTFRAPQMDDTEPFRPMVSYSKPYNVEYQTAAKAAAAAAYPIDNQASTETPQPSNYYEDDKSTVNKAPEVQKVNYVEAPKQKQKFRALSATTKSPVNHAYYTKQEEGYFDDMTKNYFNIFGQKIESNDGVTVPIRPAYEISTISTPVDNSRIQNQQLQQPILSLASDTQVNYRQPRPLINPESEFIPIVDPAIRAKYEAEQRLQLQQQQQHHHHQQQQQQQRPKKVHNVEIIKAEGYEKEQQFGGGDQIDLLRPLVQQQQQQQGRYVGKDFNRPRPAVAEGRPGSLVAYRLPGEGAHVYFLTPQPARPDYKTPEEIGSLS